MIPIIETERLVLRPFTENDVPALTQVMSTPPFTRYLEVLKLPTADAYARRFVDRTLKSYKENNFGFFAVMHKEDERLIGFCGLIVQTLPDGEQHIELGYALDPAYWGTGLATESACAVRDYAFEKLKLPYIISLIEPRNVPAIRVAEKVGMTFWKESTHHDLPVYVYRMQVVSNR